jgi:L-threonylcarbamoyladenylate synthase
MAHGPAMLMEALSRLRTGGLVAFPTETVYGLGADALDARAVAGVFAAKGRPSNNPLIVHVADISQAQRVVRDWPQVATRLAQALWPGPLTLVLPKADHVPSRVSAGGSSVAVRCPDHPLTLELLRAFGPLVGPSANISGGISPTTAEHVRSAFSPSLVYVLDGGPCHRGIESTVVSLVHTPLRVLRPGVVSAEQIAEVAGVEVEAFAAKDPASSETSDANATMLSPGLLHKHYAPTTRAILVEARAVATLLSQLSDERVVVLSHVPMQDVPASAKLVVMPAGASAYAASLYATLRNADDGSADVIVIVKPVAHGPEASVWMAVLDRLSRATA